jgi:hypothetical protein
MFGTIGLGTANVVQGSKWYTHTLTWNIFCIDVSLIRKLRTKHSRVGPLCPNLSATTRLHRTPPLVEGEMYLCRLENPSPFRFKQGPVSCGPGQQLHSSFQAFYSYTSNWDGKLELRQIT